jgi:hypothetical protein
MQDMKKNNKELQDLLLLYSAEDLLNSFFVLDLWLPNIASPVKIQYLYVYLESIQKRLPVENRIISYLDFQKLCEQLFPLLPPFEMLEDYVPELDWGDIKYYFQKNTYKIFYGGDLSNPYDYYYSYEVTHGAFEQEYLDLTKRSPVTEMKFCLELQDYMLSDLPQEKIGDNSNIKPGHIEIPSEVFWISAGEFLDQYKPEDHYAPEILNLYAKVASGDKKLPSLDSLIEKAYLGSNCRYFFIKLGNGYFPVMPRRWLTVIYDTWGTILKDNYSKIVEKLDKKEPQVLIGTRLSRFILERVNEANVYPLAGSVKPDLKITHDLIFTAIHVREKLILVYVTPPFFDQEELNKHLREIQPKLKESTDLLSHAPSRLGLLAQHKIVEFRPSKEGMVIKPIFLIAIPSPLSCTEGSFAIPEGIEAEIMTLDQIAGILDETIKVDELSEFFDYLEKEAKFKRVYPLNSFLDIFASFKDSSGVLVPGAIEPNRIILDCNWGSHFRFESLKKFWTLFPEDGLFGHPRSWNIRERTKTGLVLDSRMFFGYVYFQKIGDASFFINAPVHKMQLEGGMVNDSIMQSLFDAIDLYSHIIRKLNLTKLHNKIQIFFCPSNLASKEEDLAHLRHLIKDDRLWAMDYSRLDPGYYGVRVIYNQEKMMQALQEVANRSIQIKLLVEVLEQLSSLVSEPDFTNIRNELEREKDKQARFKAFIAEKRVSFPEDVTKVLPDEKEYKLANKEIARIALELDIQPGTYSAEEGKKKLNNLRSKSIQVLNTQIKEFNINRAIPILLEKGNALMHDSWRTETEVKASRDHEVDYERGEKSSEGEQELIHWYRIYRYLIEKFVNLQPLGSAELDRQHLKELLAFADRLMDLYSASDFINYEIYPVNVNIDRDYIVSTKDEKRDIPLMEKKYGEEQANLNLGIIGNKDDTAVSTIPIEDYLNEIDAAFKNDLNFSFRNLISVQKVMALWAACAKREENTYYYASEKEITDVCAREIRGYDVAETGAILDFLSLKSKEILNIKGDEQPAEDVPVWEHNKRLMRFDIRPLIRIGDNYYWGPHSVERTGKIWASIGDRHRLPSDLDAPHVDAVLARGHEELTKSLVEKIKEIVLRHTANVKWEIYPHKYDKSITDIGDYDVLAYFEDKNILLSIESKIIDPPYSNKDSGRMQRKIFGETKENGLFQRGYLQRVEEREVYLRKNGKSLIEKIGWTVQTSQPKVVSVLVTKNGYWCTKYPPISTDVNFVEIRLLDEFVKKVKST